MGICECAQRKAYFDKTEQELRAEMLIKYLHQIDRNPKPIENRMSEISYSVPDEMEESLIQYEDTLIPDEAELAMEARGETSKTRKRPYANEIDFDYLSKDVSFEFNPMTERENSKPVEKTPSQHSKTEQTFLDDKSSYFETLNSQDLTDEKAASVFAPKEKMSWTNSAIELKLRN